MAEYVGVDVGGTYTRAAVVNEQCQIQGMIKEKTIHGKNINMVVDQIVRMISEVSSQQQIKGVGIAVPGVVDRSGKISYASNLPELNGIVLENVLKERLNLSVSVLNDCNAAALAEAKLGSGKGYETVYYVTISTGIGGGCIHQGRVITGATGYAGEVGAILVKEGSGEAGFRNLKSGAVEGIAGGDALIEEGSRLCGRRLAHTGEVFEAAEKKEEWAVELVEQMVHTLAVMFLNINYVVNPDIFVVGGGCMKSADYFWDKILRRYMELADAELKKTKFLKAELKEAGVLGSVLYWKEREKKYEL